MFYLISIICVVLFYSYVVNLSKRPEVVDGESAFSYLHKRHPRLFKSMLGLAVALVISVWFLPVHAQGIPTVDGAAALNWSKQLAIAEAQKVAQQAAYDLQRKALQSTSLGAAAPIVNQQLNLLRNEAGRAAVGGAAGLAEKLKSTFGDGAKVMPTASATEQNQSRHDAAVVVSTSAAQQLDQMKVESERIDALAAQSKNATGQLEVMQASNEIQLETLRQLQLQRQQQLIKDQTDANEIASSATSKASNAEVIKKFWGVK